MMGNIREIKVIYKSLQEFELEWEKNISKGGIFLKTDQTPASREKVVVVAEIAQMPYKFKFPGEAVHVSPQGVGVQLNPLSVEMKEQIKKIFLPAPAKSKDFIEMELDEEDAPIVLVDDESEDEGDDEWENNLERKPDKSKEPDKSEPPKSEAADEPPTDPAQRTAWQRIQGLGRHEKAALARKGLIDERALLLRDRDPFVVLNVLQNPRITIPEIVQLTKSQNISLEMIKYIVRQPEWIAVEEVRMNLALNPKTPIPTVLSLLKKLSDGNLRSIAKRPIKQSVKSAALKLVLEKQGVRK